MQTSYSVSCTLGVIWDSLNPRRDLVLGSRWSFGVGVGGFTLHLLPFCFLGQLAFEAFPLSGLQKKGVFLDLLDDALLLNLSFKAPKGAFDGFTIEDSDLCQSVPP
jgi:hypothetical protein